MEPAGDWEEPVKTRAPVSFDQATLAVLFKAFDDAWERTKHSTPKTERGNVRRMLATSIIALARRGVTGSADQLRDRALRVLAASQNREPH
jgi:hypothetical protein